MSKEKFQQKSAQEFTIVRIMQTDIPGNKRTLAGLTYIKGVSWGISNAMCKLLQLDPMKKVSELEESEIKRIIEFLENPQLPVFMMNRRKDFETGENYHLITSKLDITKEFDIRRLKKIRSYRGLRHATGQPTRGQSTRSHFRTRGGKKAVAGIKKPVASSAAPSVGGKK